MEQANILVLTGSTRRESVHRKLAPELVTALESAGAHVAWADLRSFPLPLYDGDLEAESGLPAAALELKELARQADAFVIASPEYNGSYPAVLKNAIDWISRPAPGERSAAVFRGKVAALVSATPGGHGASRGLTQLAQLLGMIGVEVVDRHGISNSATLFDADGRVARPEDLSKLASLAAAVVRSAGAKLEAVA